MTPHVRQRRQLLLALVASLAGCGGGSSDDDAPAIAEFSADRASCFVGDSARLRIRYAGGTGRVEPGIGSVGADSVVGTGVLDRTTTFRLTVSSPGGSVSREITLPVAYRDRHRTVATLQVAEHATVALDDGTVLVIGGSRAELKVTSPWIERVDARAGTVTRAGELAAGGRSRAVLTELGDGRWLLTGGQGPFGAPDGGSEIVTVAADGTVHAAAGAPMLRHRVGHTATRLADGRVLVTGGVVTGEGALGGLSCSAEIRDADGRFRLLPSPMASARSDHTATLLADGRVLIVGGYSVDDDAPLAELFDPATETFSVLPTPGFASRAAHAAVTLLGGDVLILGGENVAGTSALASVLRYDARTRTMQAAAPLLAPRRHAAAVLTADGSVLLFGGAGAGAVPLPTAERYVPTQGAGAIAPMAAGRLEHGAVRLRGPLAGKVLLVGGWSGGWYNADVALYE